MKTLWRVVWLSVMFPEEPDQGEIARQLLLPNTCWADELFDATIGELATSQGLTDFAVTSADLYPTQRGKLVGPRDREALCYVFPWEP